ncbi:MAG: hypothetical protein SFY56_03080 [Bacteroidota bacterium]|nr:hypothetical protein [Bacteroidota bacterium]
MTRTAFSWLRLRHFRTSTGTETVFSFFLPSARFGFDKPVKANTNLAHLFLQKGRQKTNKLNSYHTQIGVLCTFFARVLDAPKRVLRAYGIFLVCLLLNINSHAQIKNPTTPTFDNGFKQQNTGTTNNTNNDNKTNVTNTNYHNSTVIESNKTFSTTYKAPTPNPAQNNQTVKILDLYTDADIKSNSTIKKQLWELKLRSFKYANPNSENYKKLQPLYEVAFDSINQMLTGVTQLDLKKAVFLVENVYYQNKLKYANFCKLIDNKVYIINQIIKQENLSVQNNVALNYAIQQLFLKPIKYIDKNGIAKIHQPLKYDFNDYAGDLDYSKQFVSKLLFTGKGQCHSMPLLYLILANEIGAKANLAYSPSHSYIAFPDNENNFYNFECTSACFPSYSFIMSSGYINNEAIKSGIYTVPTSLKETIANQLNDLGTQQLFQYKGIDDFQLKCAKRTLEISPNNIMALQTVSNYQSAKTEATACYAGWPLAKDIPNIPELKTEFDNRNNLYDYMDNLGYAPIPNNEYNSWLEAIKLQKAKQESEEIKKQILIKAKLQN